jgi:hypothetical protein
MRADRPLIGAVLFLGAGLGLIIGYCHGTTGFNAAYPFTGSILHIDMTTTGPGVLGGLLLIMVGALFLVWAFLAALVSLFTWEREPRRERRERVVERYSVVPADRHSVAPPEETTVYADTPASEEKQHFWSRPSTRSHI